MYFCNNQHPKIRYYPEKMKPELRIYNILRPFGWLYDAFTSLRNRMFDQGLSRSISFGIPVISIGNITVGGTGKTPHTEFTASLLKDKYRIAVLSRGYGRHTKGFILSDNQSDSLMIGDEPLQMKKHFPDLDVAVCEDRAKGISRLMEICSPRAIILDDAFQHRKVTPSLNILLVNWHRNILDDAILPAGRLRENARGRRRAHIIIVTKCPDNLSTEEMDTMAQRLKTHPGQQVYFTALSYGLPYPIDHPEQPASLRQAPVLAVTGIASPRLMVAELESQGHQVTLMKYPDHHRFSKKDIEHVKEKLESIGSDSVIVTTAKDAARLTGLELESRLRDRIYVLPVGVRFLRDANMFEKVVTEHVESFKIKEKQS